MQQSPIILPLLVLNVLCRFSGYVLCNIDFANVLNKGLFVRVIVYILSDTLTDICSFPQSLSSGFCPR